MNSDIKPIVDQIKSKLSQTNVDQLKQQVSQGVELGRQIVTAKAKDLLKQSKNSKVVNEVVIPWLESEQAQKAIETMNDKLKLKDTPLMSTLLKLRTDLINSKVDQARPVTEETAEEAAPTESATPAEETKN